MKNIRNLALLLVLMSTLPSCGKRETTIYQNEVPNLESLPTIKVDGTEYYIRGYYCKQPIWDIKVCDMSLELV